MARNVLGGSLPYRIDTTPRIALNGEFDTSTPRYVDVPEIVPKAPNYITSGQPQYDDQGLPILNGHDDTSLATLLRVFGNTPADGPEISFWPQKVLECIISRDRLARALREKGLSESWADAVLDTKSSDQAPKYLKMIAMLCIMEREADIEHCIRTRTTDDSFPFRFDALNKQLLCSQEDRCFKSPSNWDWHSYEYFAQRQWGLLTPYFKHNFHEGGGAEHRKFEDKILLPWSKPTPADCLTWNEKDRHRGGYGVVRGVVMPRSSHNFMPLLKKLELRYNGFALKTLQPMDMHTGNDTQLQQLFQHEVKQLNRFGGHSERHLVLLLASFQQNSNLYFLFPHAECDLSRFWTEKQKNPKPGAGYMKWVSQQLYGLIKAVMRIHSGLEDFDRSATLNPSRVMHYGRHGDIRPDNILWFRKTTDTFGILVLSDMGLSTFNRDNSKSNQPVKNENRIPVYHPPESVLKDGRINRTFDVWSLGCLFLEIVAWALGGNDYREEFATERTTVSHFGYEEKVFYEIIKIEPEPEGEQKPEPIHTVQVKERVVDWISKMHKHENCTAFIHKVLEIIQEHMLVVLSPKNKPRATSAKLLPLFEELTNMSNDEYSRGQRDPKPKRGENPRVVAMLDPHQERRIASISHNSKGLLPSPTPMELGAT
ncbi:kinase-like domain-containing protein [Apiospora saccharicola]|uniref:Kinase-like domain-containing protein n=1 Tax=Apiospora saccharicola TaxID=335842 RepID=A0ABR1WE75_9PEZI